MSKKGHNEQSKEELIETLKTTRGWSSGVWHGTADIFRYLTEEKRDDKDIALAAITGPLDAQSGYSLSAASQRLKNDMDVVKAAVENTWESFKCASKEIRENRDQVLQIVKINGFAIAHALIPFDKEVYLAAVNQNGDSFTRMPEEARRDRDIILTALKNGSKALSSIPEGVVDKEMAMLSIETQHPQGWSLMYILSKKGDFICKDEEIMLAVLKDRGIADFKYIDKDLCKKRDLMLKACSMDKAALMVVDESLKDLEMVLTALAAKKSTDNHRRDLIRAIPSNLKENPEVLALALEYTEPDDVFSQFSKEQFSKYVLEKYPIKEFENVIKAGSKKFREAVRALQERHAENAAGLRTAEALKSKMESAAAQKQAEEKKLADLTQQFNEAKKAKDWSKAKKLKSELDACKGKDGGDEESAPDVEKMISDIRTTEWRLDSEADQLRNDSLDIYFIRYLGQIYKEEADRLGEADDFDGAMEHEEASENAQKLDVKELYPERWEDEKLWGPFWMDPDEMEM
eukprot:m.47391 g.47391  ORF g.47391 m.47391 type:complete len:517 (+) comp10495_c0_seq1:50-1600(+)